MEAKAIWEALRAKFGPEVVGEITEAIPAGSEADAALGKKDYRPRDTTIELPASSIKEVMAHLRDDPAYKFDFLNCVTGVDYPAQGALADHAPQDKIAVVYHLFSYTHRHTLVLRTFLPRAEPRVPTVSHLWPVADWHERETYDLLGVIFTGHPDLRRIMLPEEFEGHPLLKDYVERPTVMGIPTTRYSALGLLGTLSPGD